jgi:polyphosphate kinase
MPTPGDRENLAKDKQAAARYLNRELSLLAFQERVLEEALDVGAPLLERVKFLSILGSNLDEFAMVRTGGLIMQKREGIVDLSLDGLLPADQLVLIRRRVMQLTLDGLDAWRGDVRLALAGAGIHVLDYADLSDKQKRQVDEQFRESVFPVLTPQAFDPGHPFPHISNLSLNLAVMVRLASGEERFARVKVPATLPRLLPIKRSSGGERKDGTVPHHHWFVWLEQVIATHVRELFPGIDIIHATPFRVTRNADFDIQELEASDLLETMAENVRERRFGAVVRLEIDEAMPAASRTVLAENLGVDANDVFTLPGPLGLAGLAQLYDIERWDLKEPPLVPVLPAALTGEAGEGGIMAAMRQGDILLHHPYVSFDPVVEFLKEAARDPDVLAIKQTLYRVGRNSPIVKYLLEARREHRKQVTVLVELKARFDEESNIGWARMLEREGVHVIYGMLGLKTHAKVLLAIRREESGLRRYLHLGTGNYNHVTARLYEDLGLLTCDPELGHDATDLFNILTGYSQQTTFRRMLVAPLNMRQALTERIDREIAVADAGRPARLVFKANSLVDRRLIDKLYEASAAGVDIDLVIRGICCVRPGVPGLSENIRVRSIVGRFLEHSRIYWFGNDGDPEVLLGSADLMSRNIDRRIEVLFPVQDDSIRRHLHDKVLAMLLADDRQARIMQPDGAYTRTTPADGVEGLDAQRSFLRSYRRSSL